MMVKRPGAGRGYQPDPTPADKENLRRTVFPEAPDDERLPDFKTLFKGCPGLNNNNNSID